MGEWAKVGERPDSPIRRWAKCGANGGCVSTIHPGFAHSTGQPAPARVVTMNNVKQVSAPGNLQKTAGARNARGWRIGEGHPRAKLSDHDIRLMLELRSRYGMGYKALALKFEAPVRTVRDICTGKRRGQGAHDSR